MSRHNAHKVGARNAAADKQRITDIRTKANEITAITVELEPDTATMSAPAKADGQVQDGVMVAFFIAPDVATQLAASVPSWPAGSEVTLPADMHVTLCYLGNVQDVSRFVSEGDLLRSVAFFAQREPLIYGDVSGSGRFVADEVTGLEPIYASVDAPELAEFQDRLCDAIMPPDGEHGFTPHITLAYVPAGKPVVPQLSEIPLVFDSIVVAWGGRQTAFPLCGETRSMGMVDDGMDMDDTDYMAKAGGLPAGKGADHGPLTRVVAIKSDTGEWQLDVLGVPFGGPNGGKDSDGEYFDASTKLYLDKYPSVPAVYYHGFGENGRPMGEPQFIGKTTGYQVKADGVWFRVVLDKTNAYAHRIWDAALKGIARASSGSILHLARYAGSKITHWPVAELSLIDAVGKRQPANQYAVAVPVLKAVYAQAGLTWPDDIDGNVTDGPEAGAKGEQQSAPAVASGAAKRMGNQAKMEDTEMTLEELRAAMAAEFKRKEDEDAAKVKAEADMEAKINAGVAAKMAEMTAQDVAARRLPGWTPGSAAPAVMHYGAMKKYDNLSAEDTSILIGLTTAAQRANLSQGPKEDAFKALALKIDSSKEDVHVAAKSAMREAGIRETALKANEIQNATLSNYGDEWVSTVWNSQLWEKIRLATWVANKIPTIEIPPGADTMTLPIQGGSATFYKVAQAIDQAANPGRPNATYTTSKAGTINKSVTASKLGAAVAYAGELEEDSLIPWVNFIRTDLTKEGGEILEHVIIDGDTATAATTNINNIGGTPGSTDVYLLFDGLRKLGLVTNTGNSRSQGGAIGVTAFLETVKLLGLAGRNAADKRSVGFIIDMWTNWKALDLAEVKTRDVFVAPTVEQGMLTNIYGYDVGVSANMHRANQDATYGLKANTSGKVDLTTAANNTTGSILAVRWDQWLLAYKRRMTFEIARDPWSDSSIIVCNMRVGLTFRDNEASAITYGITGV